MKGRFLQFILAVLFLLQPSLAQARIDYPSVISASSQNIFTPSDNTCTTNVTGEIEAFASSHNGYVNVRQGDCLLVGDLGNAIKTTSDLILRCPSGDCTLESENTDTVINYLVPDATALDSKTVISAIGIATINTDDQMQRLTVSSTSGYHIGDWVAVRDSVSLPSRVGGTKTITGVTWDAGNGKCVVTTSASHGYSDTSRVFIKGVTATVAGTKIDYLDGSDGVGRTYNITRGDGAGASLTTKFTLQSIDNATDTTAGTDINCDTGTWSSGGLTSTSNGWAGENARVAGIDTINNYIFLTQRLKFPSLYVQSPVLYRYTQARKFEMSGFTIKAKGNTADLSLGVSDVAIAVGGVPEAKFSDLKFVDTWDAAIIRYGLPGSIARNISGYKLPNRATNDPSGSPKTITGITAANPAVFTSVAHGFSNNNALYLTGMPIGYTSFNDTVCQVSDKTNDTFQCKDTYGNYLNSTGFGTFTGSATAGEAADVTGLGYLLSDYGGSFGSIVDGMVSYEGRHMYTTDGLSTTWTTTLSGSSFAIGRMGIPTYSEVSNAVSYDAIGVPVDSHEESAAITYKKISCHYPQRGPQFGSYQGRCIQARGKDLVFENIYQTGGQNGIRIVATAHDSTPHFLFKGVTIDGLYGLRDTSSTVSSVGDSTGILIADASANTFKPDVTLDDVNMSNMYIGIDADDDAYVHGSVNFLNVGQPVKAQPGSTLELEKVLDDRRGIDFSGLSGTSTTSLAIGTGTKAFTTQSGERYRPGMIVLAVSDANPTTNYMIGTVTSYSSTTLTTSMQTTSGSGTLTDWTITADWPVVTALSDAGDGGSTTRITDLRTYRNRTVPSVAFGEADTTASKYYGLSRWIDTTTATIPKIFVSPGATTLSQLTDTAGETLIDFQEFTADGTWIKPARATANSIVYIEQIAGGGGGGGGSRVLSTGTGGAGGGAGNFQYRRFKASDLTSTVAVTIGQGGAGGAGATSDGTAGNNGVAGTNTSFGSYLISYAGGFGSGGQTATNSGGGGGGGSLSVGGNGASGAGGAAGTLGGGSGGNGAAGSSNATGVSGGAGGSGCAIASGVASVGGNGGYVAAGGSAGGGVLVGVFKAGADGAQGAGYYSAAPAGGATAGTAGGNATALTHILNGVSGGGGAGNGAGAGGDAGASAGYGSGGSGGGAAVGGNGGAGSAGRPGIVRVWTHTMSQ